MSVAFHSGLPFIQLFEGRCSDGWLDPSGRWMDVDSSHEASAAALFGQVEDDGDLTKYSQKLHNKGWLRVKADGPKKLLVNGLPVQRMTPKQRATLEDLGLSHDAVVEFLSKYHYEVVYQPRADEKTS